MHIFYIMMALSLSACTTSKKVIHKETTTLTEVVLNPKSDPKGDKLFSKDMEIKTAVDTNGNMPLAIDLVFISHPALARKLNTMSAQQFFKEREQIKQDNPRFIKIRSLELIPRHSTPSFAIPYKRSDVSAAFIFARFNNKFPNRWRLHPGDTIRVHIQANQLKILSHEEGTPDHKIKIPVAKPANIMENTIILDS